MPFETYLLRYRTAITPHKVPLKRSNSGADAVLVQARQRIKASYETLIRIFVRLTSYNHQISNMCSNICNLYNLSLCTSTYLCPRENYKFR